MVCFRASNAHCSEEERRRLLTFLVVGGGPTSIEFARYVHDHVFKLPPRPKISFILFSKAQNKTRPFKECTVIGKWKWIYPGNISELHDFLSNDVYRWYPELTSADYCSVILVEAGKHLLGTFDESLSTYVEKLFAKRNVKVLTEQSVARVEGTLTSS